LIFTVEGSAMREKQRFCHHVAGLGPYASTRFFGKVCDDPVSGAVFTHDLRATGVVFDTPPWLLLVNPQTFHPTANRTANQNSHALPALDVDDVRDDDIPYGGDCVWRVFLRARYARQEFVKRLTAHATLVRDADVVVGLVVGRASRAMIRWREPANVTPLLAMRLVK